MAGIAFHAYVAVIDKARLRARYTQPYNPYEIAMLFCLESLSNRLVIDGQAGKRTHILFEGRGKAEDGQLELEFRRIAANQSGWGYKRVDFARTPLEPVFVPKAANMAGHQITDLIARALALRELRPDQPNRAADIVADKIWKLKTFP